MQCNNELLQKSVSKFACRRHEQRADLQLRCNTGGIGLASVLHVLVSHSWSKQCHGGCWHPLRHVPHISIVGCGPAACRLSLTCLLPLLLRLLSLLLIAAPLCLTPSWAPANPTLVTSARTITTSATATSSLSATTAASTSTTTTAATGA